jgi:hypothetical protein
MCHLADALGAKFVPLTWRTDRILIGNEKEGANSGALICN